KPPASLAEGRCDVAHVLLRAAMALLPSRRAKLAFVTGRHAHLAENQNIRIDHSLATQVSLPLVRGIAGHDEFDVLNRDFRYQLTCIGGFAPVYIADEMANNQFKVSGGKPGMKVSWQVTGTRQDAWANAHRIPVEQIKPQDEHGTYLHPELFGAPETSAVGWGRYRFPDNAGQ